MTTVRTQRRLDELPPELLRLICEYTLPQGLVFTSQNRHPPWAKSPSWHICAAEPRHSPHPVYCARPLPIRCKLCPTPCPIHDFAHEMQTALLYVNKALSTEGRGK